MQDINTPDLFTRINNLSHALNHLIPVGEKVVPNSDSVATFISTADVLKNRNIHDIVHAINVLAMLNTDVLDIYTLFNPVSSEFEIKVFADTRMHNDAMIYFKNTDLSSDDALSQLLGSESDLTDLIIAARESVERK